MTNPPCYFLVGPAAPPCWGCPGGRFPPTGRVVRVVPPIGRLFEHQVVPSDGQDAQGSTNPRTPAQSSPSTASRSGAVLGAVSRPPGGLCAWCRRSGGCLSTNSCLMLVCMPKVRLTHPKRRRNSHQQQGWRFILPLQSVYYLKYGN
jgi:hypothetical protein